MTPHQLAKLASHYDYLLRKLPNKLVVQLYSLGRRYFMHKFCHHDHKVLHQVTDRKLNIITPNNLQSQSQIQSQLQASPQYIQPQTLWGLQFRIPLMNAAGMFKNGEGYDIVASQRAGGYIGGTSTYNPRCGNTKHSIKLPFLSLVPADTTLNYLGLPNLGDEILAKHLITTNKIIGCPIGWSVMRSPDYPIDIAMEYLIKSLWLYHDNPQIDFIEINESCPNIGINHNVDSVNNSGIKSSVTLRLLYIAQEFLSKRKRKLPVIVKFSNDLAISELPELLKVLIDNQYDGINLGNTSTNYSEIRPQLDKEMQKLFDYFTVNFGGGVGGRTLKAKSLLLCGQAVRLVTQLKPKYEFHVIRTGGIESLHDIKLSNDIGVALNQWYSGYFTNYAIFGDDLYVQL
jgi:dihydroorotate dehydrogenase